MNMRAPTLTPPPAATLAMDDHGAIIALVEMPEMFSAMVGACCLHRLLSLAFAGQLFPDGVIVSPQPRGVALLISVSNLRVGLETFAREIAALRYGPLTHYGYQTKDRMMCVSGSADTLGNVDDFLAHASAETAHLNDVLAAHNQALRAAKSNP